MRRQDEQVVQYIPRLRRYAHALLGDSDRAEDLVQETLARALGRLHFWRRGSDMRAWLFTIMHNQFANDCRRAQKRPDAVALDDVTTEAAAADTAELHAGLHDIEQALMLLPEAQRAALLLVSLEGLSYNESARVLGIRPGTLMSRLHRAREKLRSALNHESGKVRHIRSVK
ncbi:RNA polymerase sigma-70 factor (ECF subfamily) [Thiogranum longum]|uniref:RNA polymerase sigma-70 factor (ECF subfamily) n=1 Tax=Thiogranum longum TaxID=1537524 RepID=A0A4R1HP12_9GAMM|nr:sigma-70 family RNA polymerase sigma factor [Thiogranum longum]TCK19022.1 RNA polymerase sigma-70 factor (ECF subfamily) [Thiogranum longum]